MSAVPKRLVRVLALIVAVVTAAVLVPATAANAGASCDPRTGCSHVQNVDNLYVTARRDWTCSHGTTGTLSGGCVGGPTYIVNPGLQTPPTQDWDVLRVDAG